MMVLHSNLVLFLTLVLLALAHVGNSCSGINYPTKWLLANDDNDVALNVQCTGKSGSLNMNKRVDAKTQVYYSWDGHYNDGLGLSATTWKCATADEDFPLENPKNPIYTFSTSYGENLKLTISETQNSTYTVAKSCFD